MGERADHISEFRSIVETVIMNNAAGQTGSWPGMHQYAQLGKQTYVSVDPEHGRPTVIGQGPEHRWGVTSDKVRIGNYSGRLAVVSLSSDDEALYRRISIHSGIPLAIPTMRKLDAANDIERAIIWARMPHFAQASFKELSELSAAEQEYVDREFAKDAQVLEYAAADTEWLTYARQLSWTDDEKVYLV